MICALGSWPRHQAGKAIEARCDFRWRGGRLTISRRIWPARTAASFAVISSICQFIANGVRGLSSRNARAAKLAKSWCSKAAHSADAVSPATAASGAVMLIPVIPAKAETQSLPLARTGGPRSLAPGSPLSRERRIQQRRRPRLRPQSGGAGARRRARRPRGPPPPIWRARVLPRRPSLRPLSACRSASWWRVLLREESLGNLYIKVGSRHHQQQGRHQYGELMAKDEIESTIINSDYPLENPFGRAVEATLGMQSLLFQEQRAHHRRQRQRHDRRGHHRDRYGDCEFAEQTADDAAHREQRDEDSDQIERDRNDREADLAGALERRLERPVALLDVAHNVFDHDDRIVDNETDRDSQRHQRDVVQAEAGNVHDRERREQRQWHSQARYHGRPHRAQEQKDDDDDERDRQ